MFDIHQNLRQRKKLTKWQEDAPLPPSSLPAAGGVKEKQLLVPKLRD